MLNRSRLGKHLAFAQEPVKPHVLCLFCMETQSETVIAADRFLSTPPENEPNSTKTYFETSKSSRSSHSSNSTESSSSRYRNMSGCDCANFRTPPCCLAAVRARSPSCVEMVMIGFRRTRLKW
ncbi:plasminogen-like protein [Perkinsela sp. CCAP 1560/4]|nr:plasminogen-like protein [Perkinsela sp. CCAP 1560/4]|eukprot:KNH05384.1 plasminogen-like protein [Perkinsela sp. CCAP 1560/4]